MATTIEQLKQMLEQQTKGHFAIQKCLTMDGVEDVIVEYKKDYQVLVPFYQRKLRKGTLTVDDCQLVIDEINKRGW